jgi:hypothetical protein
MDIPLIDTDVGHEAEVVPEDPKPPPLSAGPSDDLTSKLKRTQGPGVSKNCVLCTVDKQKVSSPRIVSLFANIGLKCIRSRGFDAKCDRCERLKYLCSEAPQISSDGDRQRRKLSYAKCEYCRRDRKKVCFLCWSVIMKCSDLYF